MPDDPQDQLPAMLFVRVPGAKTQKNRLHFELDPDDQAAEVQRLLALGASHVDIGQRDVGRVVLADPEGNEFCVLKPRAATAGRDELWGLAVAWFGANGIGLLWLGDWLWRRSARYRPPDGLDHQAG